MSRSVPVPVRLIGGLYVLAGGLTVGAAALLALLSLWGMALGSDSPGLGGSDREWSAMFLGVALFVALLGAVQATCGAGLCRGRPWARAVVVTVSLVAGLAALCGHGTWLATLIPLGIAGYLGLSEDVARAFRA